MSLVVVLLVAFLALPVCFVLYVRVFGGQHKLFYKPKCKTEPDYKKHPQLTAIQTRTEDGVMLRGWMAEPKDKSIMSDIFILYMHGISCEPEEKIPDLCAYADALNC
jgi:hypothetical protein